MSCSAHTPCGDAARSVTTISNQFRYRVISNSYLPGTGLIRDPPTTHINSPGRDQRGFSNCEFNYLNFAIRNSKFPIPNSPFPNSSFVDRPPTLMLVSYLLSVVTKTKAVE